MLTDLFLQAIMKFVKARIETASDDLAATLDFATFEAEMNELMNQIGTLMVAIKLADLLTSAAFLVKLKQLGAHKGMRFKEYRTVTLTRDQTCCGDWLAVAFGRTGYFIF